MSYTIIISATGYESLSIGIIARDIWQAANYTHAAIVAWGKLNGILANELPNCHVDIVTQYTQKEHKLQ